MGNSISLKTLDKLRPVNVKSSSSDDDEMFLEPHRHEYFEIVWSLKSEGSHSIDFVAYPLQASRLFMITPGQVHDSSSLGNHVRVITFHPGFLESSIRNRPIMEEVFPSSFSKQPYIDLDSIGQKELDMLYSIMERELTLQEPDWNLLESLLSSFLRYLNHYLLDREQQGGVRQDKRVVQLIDVIEQNYRYQRKAEFYAGKLALTSKRLNELTKQFLGKTVTGLIHDRIILEAHRELAFTGKTVKNMVPLQIAP